VAQLKFTQQIVRSGLFITKSRPVIQNLWVLLGDLGILHFVRTCVERSWHLHRCWIILEFVEHGNDEANLASMTIMLATLLQENQKQAYWEDCQRIWNGADTWVCCHPNCNQQEGISWKSTIWAHFSEWLGVFTTTVCMRGTSSSYIQYFQAEHISTFSLHRNKDGSW